MDPVDTGRSEDVQDVIMVTATSIYHFLQSERFMETFSKVFVNNSTKTSTTFSSFSNFRKCPTFSQINFAKHLSVAFQI